MVQVHVTFALIALALGPAIVLRRKGDRPHRIAGRAFVTAMVLLNLSALTLYDLTGGPNLFHALALVSLATIAAGLSCVRRGDIPGHLTYMGWAYAGMIMALANRLAPLLPLPFWTASLLLILVIGTVTHFILKRFAAVTRDEDPSTAPVRPRTLPLKR